MPLLTHHDAEVDRLFRQTRRFLVGGGFLLLALIAVVVLRQGVFDQTISYFIRADSASEIAKGMPVKVAGFRIGSVAEMVLEPDASVRVRLEVDPDYRSFVHRDSVALLTKEGLIGGSVFEIVTGNNDSPQAAPKAQLVFARELGLSGIAQQLKEEIVPVVRDVKQITGTLADPERGIQPTLDNLKLASAELNVLLKNGNSQLATVLTQTSENLERIGKTVDSVNARLPKILDDVQTVSTATASNAPAALRDGRIIARDVREAVSGARRVWPLNSIAPRSKQGEVPADSEIMEQPRAQP